MCVVVVFLSGGVGEGGGWYCLVVVLLQIALVVVVFAIVGVGKVGLCACARIGALCSHIG